MKALRASFHFALLFSAVALAGCAMNSPFASNSPSGIDPSSVGAPPPALENTNPAAYWAQYMEHDRAMVKREILPPSVLDIDRELAKTPRGSSRYAALWKEKNDATLAQMQTLAKEGRLAPFHPTPLGGTYAPANMPQSSSEPDLRAIGWKRSTSCVYPDGPTGPSICNGY